MLLYLAMVSLAVRAWIVQMFAHDTGRAWEGKRRITMAPMPLPRGTFLATLVVLLTVSWAGTPAAPRVGPVATQAVRPEASALAARVQARYATVRDFTADFTQTEVNPLLPKPVVDRGQVKVLKPSRMRWTYTTGDRNEFVSDGTRQYSYFRRDRYVQISPLPGEGEASTALLFLAGRGNLVRDFTATLPSDQPDDEWRLVLRPRTPQADFETLTLEVDRRSLALRGLVATDAQGTTRAFRFDNMRENPGLAAREFEFDIPRGVEIR